MVMFAWSNATTAALVGVGREVNWFGFSLANTVTDLWHAGLMPLSIFVCLFSGIYPYFKLLVIVLYSVILQRPQSRVLRFVDALGKFSLMDIFVMMILVTGCEIQGIADVRILPSFYIFLTATMLSLLVGNYATHGWRREGRTGADGQLQAAEELLRQISDLPSDDDVSLGDGASPAAGVSTLRRRTLLNYQWKVAVPAAIVIFPAALLVVTQKCLEYKISGVATFIAQSTRPFSLFELFSQTSAPVLIAGVVTIIAAPCVYAAAYPIPHFLGAWCASDALLLACVGGLLQLEDFITWMIGPSMRPFYSAECTLLWPLAVLLVSTLAQWVLITKDLFHLKFSFLGEKGHRAACGSSFQQRGSIKEKNAVLHALKVAKSYGVEVTPEEAKKYHPM
jgi:hypothetical protein